MGLHSASSWEFVMFEVAVVVALVVGVILLVRCIERLSYAPDDEVGVAVARCPSAAAPPPSPQAPAGRMRPTSPPHHTNHCTVTTAAPHSTT